jgi:hypothetical protein
VAGRDLGTIERGVRGSPERLKSGGWNGHLVWNEIAVMAWRVRLRQRIWTSKVQICKSVDTESIGTFAPVRGKGKFSAANEGIGVSGLR